MKSSLNRSTRRAFAKANRCIQRGTKVPGGVLAKLNLDALNTTASMYRRKVLPTGWVVPA